MIRRAFIGAVGALATSFGWTKPKRPHRIIKRNDGAPVIHPSVLEQFQATVEPWHREALLDGGTFDGKAIRSPLSVHRDDAAVALGIVTLPELKYLVVGLNGAAAYCRLGLGWTRWFMALPLQNVEGHTCALYERSDEVRDGKVVWKFVGMREAGKLVETF